MRVAPVGLVSDEAFSLATEVAAITHTHPTGYLAAGAFAHVIAELVRGKELPAALASAQDRAAKEEGSSETVRAIGAALDLAVVEPVAKPEAIAVLGQGCVAEEALSIAAYCALTAGGFRNGVLAAVNHSGDSDSTGSMCGQLLGAILGGRAVPQDWVKGLAERAVVERLAEDLAAHFVDGLLLQDCDRYPTW